MGSKAQQGVKAAPGITTFSTGATRSNHVAGAKTGQFPLRYDLISPIGLRRLAETYGEGFAKYQAGNWLRGIPNWDLMNHALAHCNDYMAGDRSEDHLAHAVWNLFTLIHFEEAGNPAEPEK